MRETARLFYFIKPSRQSCVAFIVLLLAASMTMSTYSAEAQVADDQSESLFGCSVFGKDTVHCDLLPNKLESTSMDGTTKKVYAVTRADNEIPFAGGVNGGQALQFRAYFGEFVNVTNTDAIDPAQFSVSFWIKKDLEFPNYGHVISHVNAARNSGWAFDTYNTTSQSIRFEVFNSDGQMFSSPELPVSETAFAHIIGIFDGSSIRVYKDGALVGQPVHFNGTYIADPQVPLKIAMISSNFASPWGGTIDDMGLFNRALTEQEVKTIFASVSKTPATAIPSGLVGYWPFEGSVGDASGRNNPTAYLIQAASMTFASDGRMFFTEKNTGKIRIMQNDSVLDVPFATVPDLHYDMEQGLLGITIDPDFEENHFVYVYYTYQNQSSTESPFNRVVRFTDTNNTATDMTVILDNIHAHRGGMHAGGALAFGPDGKLYVTVGNAYEPEEAQNLDSLLGKVLRINKDGTIPADNPFPNSPVYSLGHRNMFGIAFNNSTGIVTENGDDLYDEINLLVRGGNFGYPTIQMPNTPPELSNSSLVIKPLRSYWKTIAPTQAVFYDGDEFSELKGKFIVGSYNNGRLYALSIDDQQNLVGELKVEFPYKYISNIIAVGQSPAGEIYYGGYYIYKLQSIDAASLENEIATVEVSYDQELPEHMVTDVQINPIERTVVADVQNTSKPVELSMKIQKELLDGITLVTIAQGTSYPASLNFTTDSSEPGYNVVKVTLPPLTAASGPAHLTVTGSRASFGLSDDDVE